jgi:ribosomal protein S18 acetylase RimI-like enzyme
MTQIRAICETDGSLLRALHLRMYADSPDAFSETLEAARALTPPEWEARSRHFADASNAIAFVAMQKQEPVGFIAGYVGRFHDGAMNWDYRDTVTLARAWVDSAFRRRGIGQRLVEAGRSWARERQAKTLAVQVTENNGPAIGFYVKLGFVDTGRREPLLSNPSLQIHFLSQPLQAEGDR